MKLKLKKRFIVGKKKHRTRTTYTGKIIILFSVGYFYFQLVFFAARVRATLSQSPLPTHLTITPFF